MDTKYKFSIIIPTYNRELALQRCLNSLATQTYKNFEVIVCDDGSTDKTRDIVNQLSKTGLNIQYIYMKNWGGPAKPRNNGIAKAQGEWICFLDSDDWWYEDRLEKTLPYCNAQTDISYINFDLYRGGTPLSKQHKGRHLKNPVFEDLFINDNCIVNSGVCIRKSLIVQVGGFSEDKALIAVEDYDLWLRFARLTNKFTYIPLTLGVYEEGDDNISMKYEAQLKRIDILFDKHVHFLKNNSLQKIALINWSYKKALIYLKAGNLQQAKILFKTAVKSRNFLIKLKSCFYLIKQTAR